ncbi:hypothetical protein JAAARDRAFT_81048 [Jaapia argillacea MUCL 33604]|uniref:F-box domain-containing protein n=1 Tax=Jaapia argillacea MUCL 33604 TaxID=933084 RepID=A0A067PQD1_9AGAM|nr:hypothetical protein JAAARDRAFT_81048 [Jaapia argillacea MUCL 33604]
MTQHHALQISEIIREICQKTFGSTSRAADLAAMARCCRAFEGPANDVLWSNLEDVEPLLKLIPTLSVSLRSVCSGTARRYKLKGPTTPNDWGRFDHYTGRVRCIAYDARGGIGSTDFTEVVIDLRKDRGIPLLPRLRALNCSLPLDLPRMAPGVRGALSLCPPSLRALRICGVTHMGSYFPDDPEFSMILESLPDRFPGLQHFLVAGDIPKRVFDFAAKFPKLVTLDLDRLISIDDTILPRGLQSFSVLPKLECLSLHDLIIEGKPPSPRPAGFSSLVQLSILQPDVTGFLFILNLLSPGPLKRLSIENVECIGIPYVNLLRIFPPLCPFTSLEVVLISSSNAMLFLDDGPAVSAMTVIGPLLAMHGLRELQIRSWPNQFDLRWTDDDVRLAAIAWPCLENLYLCFPCSGPSIRALGFFAEFCPRLEYLWIWSLGGVPDDLKVNQAITRRNPRVRALFFFDDSSCDIATLTRYLYLIFPCLESLGSNGLITLPRTHESAWVERATRTSLQHL